MSLVPIKNILAWQINWTNILFQAKKIRQWCQCLCHKTVIETIWCQQNVLHTCMVPPIFFILLIVQRLDFEPNLKNISLVTVWHKVYDTKKWPNCISKTFTFPGVTSLVPLQNHILLWYLSWINNRMVRGFRTWGIWVGSKMWVLTTGV